MRASKKLRNDELLLDQLRLDQPAQGARRGPLWRGNHVAVKQLVEDFARYLYLPRLEGSAVLVQAIRDGLGLLTWEEETFAFADSFDEAAAATADCRAGTGSTSRPDSAGFLVKPDVASKQLDAEVPPPRCARTPIAWPRWWGAGSRPGVGETPPTPPAAQQLRRFHGSVRLDSTRVGRDAGRIADEVIAHLAGQMGAEVTVTIEIEARLPNGATDQLVRTVTENSRTLKFDSQGFEKE